MSEPANLLEEAVEQIDRVKREYRAEHGWEGIARTAFGSLGLDADAWFEEVRLRAALAWLPAYRDIIGEPLPVMALLTRDDARRLVERLEASEGPQGRLWAALMGTLGDGVLIGIAYARLEAQLAALPDADTDAP